jgi:hypothetical protein
LPPTEYDSFDSPEERARFEAAREEYIRSRPPEEQAKLRREGYYMDLIPMLYTGNLLSLMELDSQGNENLSYQQREETRKLAEQYRRLREAVYRFQKPKAESEMGYWERQARNLINELAAPSDDRGRRPKFSKEEVEYLKSLENDDPSPT